MIAKALTALLLLTVSAVSCNAAIICKTEESNDGGKTATENSESATAKLVDEFKELTFPVGIKIIEWDDQNGIAKVTDSLNNTHVGRVTLTRKHDGGKKVNIYVRYDRVYYGNDAAEYIVFPVVGGQHRAIGVGYVLNGTEKILNSSVGNFVVNCSRS